MANKEMTTSNADVDALAQQGYTIGHKVGEGSYATVITASYKDDTNGKDIELACKVIDKSKAPTDFVNKFFPRELDILTKLDHPNIIQIHSILQRGLRIFIFMRYAEKGDLLTHIKKNGFIKESHTKVWFLQMAAALKYLHSHDIAHRDLKCENILLSRHSNVKLADFGFACFCTNEAGSKLKSQTYCGSAAYAAPEVVCGVPYDPKLADAWSLGVILFIMLNGKMPFDDSNLAKLLEDQRGMKFAFRHKLHDVITPQAKASVAVLLDPNPATRWNMNEITNCTWVRMDKRQKSAVACMLPHAASGSQSNHSGIIGDTELSASERNRRLIPYMAFYLPAPELPINQQYAVKHAAAAGAAQLRPPTATTPSRIPVPVAYMPQQHPHSQSQSHSHLNLHPHPLSSSHYQSGAAEVYHALAVGGGHQQHQHQHQHQLVAVPVHGKENQAPASETGASTFIAYKPLHPTHKHKTVQHFPPLSQQKEQQQELQQEQFELLAPPLQLQQFHRQRGKQSKVNLTPFTAQNTLPGHFMPIIYTPTSKSITTSTGHNNNNKNNKNNNELHNGNTINYNKKQQQPPTEIVYHKNSHQTQLVTDYAGVGSTSTAEHDMEQQQQPRQEKAVLPTPSVGYNVVYSEPASPSSASASSSSSLKVQQKSPSAYGHVSKYESYFHMAPNQPSSEPQLTPQEKYVLYLQQRMKLQRQQQQSERYHADTHHHQSAQSNTKAGKHPHTHTHTHTQSPSPQTPQGATHHSQSTVHGYNTHQQQQQSQSQQVLHIPLRAIMGQLHEHEPVLGSPAPTHFIDYLIDGPRQSLDEEQQQQQEHQQQHASPSRAPPQHAYILVTTSAPYTEHDQPAPPPPLPPRIPDLLPPTRAPVLYKQQPTLRLQPVTPVSNYKATRRPVYINAPTPSETVKITPKYVYVSSKPPTGPTVAELPPQPRPIPTGPPPVKLKPVFKYTPDRPRPNQVYVKEHEHVDDDQLPDIRTSSLAEILHKLQASNHLPHTLTPDNIDNSIKTLIRILNNLKQTQTIVANPPQHHETKPTSNSPDYDYHTETEKEQHEEEEEEEQRPTVVAHVDAHVLPNKHPGPTTGRAGIDYPNYAEIPKTSFECTQQRYKGFFGDPETNCQVWHYCDLNGGKASFLCPNGTIFSQIALTCDWWFNVKCSTTSQLYVLNERLYKYILPFNPKFPEDYNGPIVDKYLAMKFQEMEEKMRQEKQRKINQQPEKATAREEASTPAMPKNHKPSPKHGSGINAQVYEQSSERNLLIDDEIDDISERGTYDTYGQTPTTVMAPTTTSQDAQTLGHRPIFVSSTPEPESEPDEADPALEPHLERDPSSSESDEAEDKLQSLRDTKAAAGQKQQLETTRVSVEKLEVIEIKADGATGHLMPITDISESSEETKESTAE